VGVSNIIILLGGLMRKKVGRKYYADRIRSINKNAESVAEQAGMKAIKIKGQRRKFIIPKDFDVEKGHGFKEYIEMIEKAKQTKSNGDWYTGMDLSFTIDGDNE
jgi:hypothetical protein